MTKQGTESVSNRDVLQGLLERTRNPKNREQYEAMLAVPPAPVELLYLLGIFNRIRGRVNSTGFGPGRITLGDISDFVRLTKTRLDPWEVEVLEKLDDKFMRVQAEAQAAEAAKGAN